MAAAAGLCAKGLQLRSSTSMLLANVASRTSSPTALNTTTHMRRLRVLCHSEPAGGCCGGSSSSSGSGSSCSSHGKNVLENLGKEFEQLVAKNTLLEAEEEYVTGPMQGNITREIVQTVMETEPYGQASENETCLDISEILREARNMSSGDLVFAEDSDFVIV